MTVISDFLSRVVCLTALLFVTLLSLLPYQVLLTTIGRCFYFLAYSVMRYRYQVVIQNLSRAFPEKPYSEIHTLAKGFYRHFSSLIVEVIKSISISERKMANQICITNMDVLDYYHRQGKPMVALLGHYGNWESLSILANKLPFQVNALYKPLSNAPLCNIVKRIRSRFGMHLIPAGRALRQLTKMKDRPALNLFIADQFPGGNNGYRMEFLNQSTSLFDGAEKLAKTIDAIVLYIELEKTASHGWDVSFSVITDSAKDTPAGEITQRFGERLQQTIRKAPAYWLWSHRRWK